MLHVRLLQAFLSAVLGTSLLVIEFNRAPPDILCTHLYTSHVGKQHCMFAFRRQLYRQHSALPVWWLNSIGLLLIYTLVLLAVYCPVTEFNQCKFFSFIWVLPWYQVLNAIGTMFSFLHDSMGSACHFQLSDWIQSVIDLISCLPKRC